jgi:hypothetical protein
VPVCQVVGVVGVLGEYRPDDREQRKQDLKAEAEEELFVPEPVIEEVAAPAPDDGNGAECPAGGTRERRTRAQRYHFCRDRPGGF